MRIDETFVAFSETSTGKHVRIDETRLGMWFFRLKKRLFWIQHMSKKMAMRQTTRFSLVSSNWDDSLGSEHLQSDI